MKSRKDDSALFKPGDLVMPDFTCGSGFSDLESTSVDLWTVEGFELYKATGNVDSHATLIDRNDIFIYICEYVYLYFTYDIFYYKNKFLMNSPDSKIMTLKSYPT